MKLIRYFLALALASTVYAQTPTAPKVSDEQKWHMEALSLRVQLIQAQAMQQAGPHIQERQALIDQMMKANPGYIWHEAERQGETSGLVPVQTNAAPATTPRK